MWQTEINKVLAQDDPRRQRHSGGHRKGFTRFSVKKSYLDQNREEREGLQTFSHGASEHS